MLIRGLVDVMVVGLHIQKCDEISHKESLIKVMSPGLEGKEAECG